MKNNGVFCAYVDWKEVLNTLYYEMRIWFKLGINVRCCYEIELMLLLVGLARGVRELLFKIC